MEKKKIVSLLALVACCGQAVAVSAVTQEEWQQKKEERTQAIEERKEAFQEKKEEMIEKRCERVEKRIQERISRFEEGKTKRINVYNSMLDRLKNAATKLKDKGYDVSQLEKDIETLESKIKKFSDDYASFIKKLGETKEYACGKSEGQYKAKLQEARALLPTLQADAKDIREFFSGTIKDDLEKIRSQKVGSAEVQE